MSEEEKFPLMLQLGLLAVSLGLWGLLAAQDTLETDQASAFWVLTVGFIILMPNLARARVPGERLFESTFRLVDDARFWFYTGEALVVGALGMLLLTFDQSQEVTGAVMLILVGLVIIFNYTYVTKE